jgi:hypothetical protein
LKKSTVNKAYIAVLESNKPDKKEYKINTFELALSRTLFVNIIDFDSRNMMRSNKVKSI